MEQQNEYAEAWRVFPLGLPRGRYPRLTHIVSAVSLLTGVSILDLRSRRRGKREAEARHLVCYLAREMTILSYPQIAKQLDRDHTTIMHGVQRVEKWLADNKPGLDEDIKELKRLVMQFAGGHT